MLFIIIILFIIAYSYVQSREKTSYISNMIMKIVSYGLLISVVLTINAINIQTIGSGIGIYSGLFHITYLSLHSDLFFFFLASILLISIL